MDPTRPNDRRPPGERVRTPVCAAPFVAMEFDQFGDVQACCANALYPLGNVATTSLREIWNGPRAVALREALLRGDLSYGCGVCRHRLEHEHGELPRDYYDSFPFTSLHPEWPYSLQFSLHNTCNLECAMCGADRSSKIRSRRSHLEPLPHAYGDEFFEQLGPFLEHCGAADFSGGEPFLVTEHVRVWDMLAQLDRPPLCSLTTNGTVWNDRVERALDQLDFHVAVSMDGVTAATFERVRVGARFDDVRRNLDRFARYTSERGTQLTITFCLVQQNWFELGAMLRFAEDRGIAVKVQTVIEPGHGVQRLPTDDLAFVVDALRREGEDLEGSLVLNRAMWDRELRRLTDELAQRRSPTPQQVYMEPPDPGHATRVESLARSVTHGRGTGRRRGRVTADDVRRELERWSGSATTGTIRLSRDGIVRQIDLGAVLPDGTSLDLPDGATLAGVLTALEDRLDSAMWIGEECRNDDRVDHTLWFGRPVRDKVGLVVRLVALPGADGGVDVTLAADHHLMPTPSGLGVPVALGARRQRAAALAPANPT